MASTDASQFDIFFHCGGCVLVITCRKQDEFWRGPCEGLPCWIGRDSVGSGTDRARKSQRFVPAIGSWNSRCFLYSVPGPLSFSCNGCQRAPTESSVFQFRPRICRIWRPRFNHFVLLLRRLLVI